MARKKAMKRLSPTERRKAENAPRADDRAPSKRAPAAELTRLGDSALYAFVYPNLMINRYGPWMDVNVVLPAGPNECVVLFDYFIRADAAGATDAFVNESLRASDTVQSEDKWLCEKVQGGLESPGYGTGRYAPAMEAAMYHFHRRLWRDLTEEA